jgi:transcriptional regulator with XRE-family HTH domain
MRTLTEMMASLPDDQKQRIMEGTELLLAEHRLLQKLRRQRKVSQRDLAKLMSIRQPSLSQMENQEDIRLSTLKHYVEALGGKLEIRAMFDDTIVELSSLTRRR